MTDYYSKIKLFCEYLHKNPTRLEEKCSEMKKKLDLCCGNGQGTGNKCTDQEAAFATILEEQGWKNINKSDTVTDPYCYIYQAQGTQQSIDFKLVSNQEGTQPILFDLKHGSKDSIFLNDGTFLPDVIYVISFTRTIPRIKGSKERKCQREQICTLALGQEIFSEKDSKVYEERIKILKEINEKHIDTDFLRLYCRNANQYSCKQFTNEFNTKAFDSITTFLDKKL